MGLAAIALPLPLALSAPAMPPLRPTAVLMVSRRPEVWLRDLVASVEGRALCSEADLDLAIDECTRMGEHVHTYHVYELPSGTLLALGAIALMLVAFVVWRRNR